MMGSSTSFALARAAIACFTGDESAFPILYNSPSLCKSSIRVLRSSNWLLKCSTKAARCAWSAGRIFAASRERRCVPSAASSATCLRSSAFSSNPTFTFSTSSSDNSNTNDSQAAASGLATSATLSLHSDAFANFSSACAPASCTATAASTSAKRLANSETTACSGVSRGLPFPFPLPPAPTAACATFNNSANPLEANFSDACSSSSFEAPKVRSRKCLRMAAASLSSEVRHAFTFATGSRAARLL
mmetsp:Transcript_51418/g.112707  ORF Transcript_51418/g.112707 Transcript_51418/m.112707 type:complete len:246 (+) Transcript_51418:1928-2665(+)